MESVRITSLSLEYFRGIRKGKVEGLSQVNVFVGPNNSGKSSILFAIYLFAGLLGNGRKRFPSYTKYTVQEHGGGLPATIFFYKKLKPHESVFGENVAEVEVVGDTPFKISKYFFYNYEPIFPLQVRIGVSEKREHIEYILSERKHANSVKNALKNFMTKHFMLERLEILKEKIRVSDAIPSFLFFNRIQMIFAMEDPRKPEEIFFEDLLKKNLDEALYRVLQKVFRLQVKNMTYTPDGIFYLKLKDRAIRFEDLGDGAKRTMRMLFTAAAAAKGALLLEEPENHQHPRSLQESIRALLTAAKDLDIQIFATTHSRECLVAFHEEAKHQGLEARFFYTRLHENDELEVISVTPEGLDAFEEMGLDLRYYGSQD